MTEKLLVQFQDHMLKANVLHKYVQENLDLAAQNAILTGRHLWQVCLLHV